MPPAPALTPPADTAAPAPRKGGLKRVLVVLVVGLICGGAGFGAGWFLYSRAPSPMDDALRLIERDPPEDTTAADAGAPQKQRKPVPENESFVTTYHAFPDPLTTNLNESRRFLQVAVTLSTQYDAQVITNVTTHEAALRSDMLAAMGMFSETDINGPDGRARLAAALRDAVNARLMALEGFGGIEGVFFTTFVLQ